jgi:excisionase family DNA binding protein
VSGRLLTAREVGERLGLTTETILRWTRRGDLPAFKLGCALRYREADIEAWLGEHATGAAPRGVSATRDGRAQAEGYAEVRSLASATPPRHAATTEEET